MIKAEDKLNIRPRIFIPAYNLLLKIFLIVSLIKCLSIYNPVI